MNEEALKKQIELLKQVIELQKQLLAAKGMSYPVFVPYVPYQPYVPFPPYKWEPYTYTTGAVDGVTASGSSITYTS